MKRSLTTEECTCDKKRKYNHDDDDGDDLGIVTVVCLDENCSSNLLTSKIRDIKDKDTKIWKTIYNAFQDGSSENIKYLIPKIDLVRDGTFIYDNLEKIAEDEAIMIILKFKLWRLQSLLVSFASQTECNFLEFVKNNDRENEIRKNREIVLELVKKNGYEIQFVAEELKNDKEIVMESINENGMLFQEASEELRGDKEFLFQIIDDDPWGVSTLLQFVSEELRNDRDLVVAVITKDNGCALQHASEELQDDKEIVKMAVKKNPEALVYASYELRHDRDFIIEVLQQNVKTFEFIPKKMRNDREIVSIALSNGRLLEFVLPPLRSDREILKLAVKNDGNALEFVPEELKNDDEIVGIAVNEIITRIKMYQDKFKEFLKTGYMKPCMEKD